MHIPKTSGSSLMRALDDAFPPALALRGLDRCLFGTFSDFDSFTPSIRDTIFDSPAALPADRMLIAGHISFTTLQTAYPAAQIMTVLREPWSRLLSHWLFWRQHTDAMLAGLGSWADLVRWSRRPLAEFLNEPRLGPAIDNVALRMLLWPHPLLPEAGFIAPEHDETLLTAAMERLGRCSFVDITENDSFAENIQAWLGRSLTYPHINETSQMPKEVRAPLHRELTEAAHERLVARSRLDLRLWTAIAQQRLSSGALQGVRERMLLTNLARYGALMAA
jgi:hypothetical protein